MIGTEQIKIGSRWYRRGTGAIVKVLRIMKGEVTYIHIVDVTYAHQGKDIVVPMAGACEFCGIRAFFDAYSSTIMVPEPEERRKRESTAKIGLNASEYAKS